jgi:hypothetical protein
MSKHENEAAELFDHVWRRDTYSGFSRNTRGQSSTPFLDAFLQEMNAMRSAPGARPPRVVELGAGSCDHALRCALEGFPTTAVEYSGVAVTAAKERARRCADLPLEIVQADLFAFTAQLAKDHLAKDELANNPLANGSPGGVYANSVFHFLTADERRAQYRILRGALLERGVIGISFKANGDALERRGSVVKQTAAGPVVKGDDGICRLFVAPAGEVALAEEMTAEGYTVRRVIRWSVPDYNISSESGEFVGLLATR